MTIAMLCLGAGFLLFYVVPFLPFLYFFFGVCSWIKGLFEAMVGVPLWALAHIRIDGDGLPGEAAMAGYYMLLEIFLRPIMLIFGLLASILIFAAQVRVLHDIWGLVTSNLTGFDTQKRGRRAGQHTGSLTQFREVIDQFFFTVIYAIIVYMLGNSSFKLITMIPSRIMRWMGATGGAFKDQGDDPAQGLMGKMSGAVSIMQNQIGGLGGAAAKAKGQADRSVAARKASGR